LPNFVATKVTFFCNKSCWDIVDLFLGLFTQKAMGWVLRQAHRHFPQSIEDFVAQQPLPALSRREALKHA
jgi:3-methyladenine DNA glycosylase AlkD